MQRRGALPPKHRRAPMTGAWGNVGDEVFFARVPASLDQLRPVRADLGRWLGSSPQVHPVTVGDVQLAVTEALVNAIEHGHADKPDGQVSVEARWGGRALYVTVQDEGRWLPSTSAPDRGRGLQIIGLVGSQVRVSTSTTGTTVSIVIDDARGADNRS